MSFIIVASAILLACIALVQLLFRSEQPRIPNLPEIPGWPVVGNLLQLGTDHAAVCMQWAKKYGPVFQVRYATNSSLSSSHFICRLSSALCSMLTPVKEWEQNES
jgi:phenylacetate 2-hydroxylase